MVPTPALQPVRSESLSAQVAERIRSAIYRGELKPGQTLRELVLARAMNVSQATVREALAQLEHNSLVLRTPNRGTTVTSLTPKDIHDRVTTRVVLEMQAFREASERVTVDDITELRELMSIYEAAAEASQMADAALADKNLHRRIWEISGNAVVLRALDQVTDPLFAFLYRYHRASFERVTAQPHRKLIDTLAAKNQEAILAAIREHIEVSYEPFLNGRASGSSAIPIAHGPE